jgi:ABC-type multidrug transport system fused ATPase/permease subunit
MGKDNKVEITSEVEMEELLTNTRPVMFGLIGFAILYYSYRNTKKQRSKKASKQLANPLIRMILAVLVFTVVAFMISIFFTTSLVYALINTAALVVLFILYLTKIMSDVKSLYG